MCALEKIHILDGGFATQLCSHVNDPVDGTPLWSASFLYTNPDAIIKTHLDFLRAGAQILMTNTYQASIDGFVNHLGLSKEKGFQLIKTAVELAKAAHSLYMTEIEDSPGSILGFCSYTPHLTFGAWALYTAGTIPSHFQENYTDGDYPGSLPSPDATKILIAGAIGPYGSSLHDCSEYTGSYADHVSRKEMADWHRPRIQALVEAGIDLLAFETIPAQSEAEVLVELLKEFPEQKAWLAFSCKDECHICHGEKFQEVAKKCWDLNPTQIVAIGVNCLSPKYVSSLLKNINMDREDNPIPLIVYPNSGENYDLKMGWVDREKCCPVENYIQEWLDLGVTYIGGCCRTYASDIVKIKDEVNKWVERKKTVCQLNGYI